MNDERNLSDKEVKAALGIRSSSTLWKLRKEDPTFPRPIRMTPGKQVTPASELDAWKAARPRVERR